MKYNKLIKITWIDSAEDQFGWVFNEDIKELEVTIIESVGYVVQENKELIKISPHKAKDQVAGCMTIPKCAIKNMKNLK